MGKAFEKQIKTIEDQGKKQLDALNFFLKKTREQIVNDDYKDKVLYSKEREIFKNIYNKRLDKIEELTKKIDGNNLTFPTISAGETVDFSRKNDPLTLLKNIRDGKITVERAKLPKLQKYLNNNIKKYEKEIKLKSKKKKKIVNLNILFHGRNEAIKFYDDYKCLKDYQ